MNKRKFRRLRINGVLYVTSGKLIGQRWKVRMVPYPEPKTQCVWTGGNRLLASRR